LLAERIEKIQKVVDGFELEGCSNLQIWVDELDKRISDILVDRLEKRLQQWVGELTTPSDEREEGRSLVAAYPLRIKMQN
jgi:hypothetical protein